MTVARLAGFSCRQVIKRLKKLGFEFDRQAAGSHEIWYNPRTKSYITIPNHPGDMPEGTFRAFRRDTRRRILGQGAGDRGVGQRNRNRPGEIG